MLQRLYLHIFRKISVGTIKDVACIRCYGVESTFLPENIKALLRSLTLKAQIGCNFSMTIDLDAYGFAAISLTWNDPITKMPFTYRMTNTCLQLHNLRIILLGNNFHLRLKRAAVNLGGLQFKQYPASFELSGNRFLGTSSTPNHKVY